MSFWRWTVGDNDGRRTHARKAAAAAVSLYICTRVCDRFYAFLFCILSVAIMRARMYAAQIGTKELLISHSQRRIYIYFRMNLQNFTCMHAPIKFY